MANLKEIRNRITSVQSTMQITKLDKKQLTLELDVPTERIPEGLNGFQVELANVVRQIIYSFDTQANDTGIPAFLKRIGVLGVEYKDLHTEQSSLEDIFVSLVHAK